MPLLDPNSTEYLRFLPEIAHEDVDGLARAQQSYGNSWKQRGGVGAYMMLARKWDRIEKRMAQKPVLAEPGFAECEHPVDTDRYDIFQHLRADDRAEGLIDDIRDLRRYLMLVESEAMAQKIPCAVTTHRDNETQLIGSPGVDVTPPTMSEAANAN